MDAATACCGIQVDSYTLVKFWLEIWKKHRVELTSRGIVSEIRLKQLSLDRLEWPAIHPTDNICILSSRKKLGHHDDQSPRKVCLTNEYVSGLKYFHQYYPDLQVLICGVLGNRFAIFRHKFTDDDFKECPFQVIQDYKFVKRRRIYGYYCIPYKDNV
ncbi:hypothetical protein Agabi119p4_2331 [Agaricus bisporus var. burnettii]|uniref:Uncharacterized protein n=1 Tax=Agaricus bisporus var. burnettii TaxID=192524 RepID=A0A8H7KK93_AGABI|nr:hypothetical protein Agabi119p4_2331 [Agaricus bisporus var. burnettii]